MTETPAHAALRLSDADREEVADRIRRAAADGRLTLDEADERQRAAYEARVAADLVPLTADLPAPPPVAVDRHRRGPLTARARRRLAVHGTVALAFVLLLLTRWAFGQAVDPGQFGPGRFEPGAFFPVFPMLLIGLSLFVHQRRAERKLSAA